MGIKDGYTFAQAYGNYLEWFRERAAAWAQPKSKEEVLGLQMCHEDVYESEGLILNRMYFFIPLLPSETKSGRVEGFAICEWNLFCQSEGADCFEDVKSVGYTVQGLS